jgi:thiol-disulfide isomerase/thioredoxin
MAGRVTSVRSPGPIAFGFAPGFLACGMPVAPDWLTAHVSQGTWVLLVALVLASVFGLWRAVVDGRFRGTHRVRGVPETAVPTPSVLAGADIEHTLGERATLVQFSSAFCAPCRATRRVLTDIAGVVPGVEYVEVDAENHLELVRRLGVVRTPTTLVLDAAGREVVRAAGAPRKEDVLSALAQALQT